MSSHVTLRGLLGLGDEPAALQDSALIMIDCQNTYRRGVMQLDGRGGRLRRGGPHCWPAPVPAGIPVIPHPCTTPARGRPMTSRPRSARSASEVAPADGRARGRQALPELVLPDRPRRPARRPAGARPGARRVHDAHVRQLHGAGRLQPRLPADASWPARPPPGSCPCPGGAPVPAATLQTATLAGIADLFAVVVWHARRPPRLTRRPDLALSADRHAVGLSALERNSRSRSDGLCRR